MRVLFWCLFPELRSNDTSSPCLTHRSLLSWWRHNRLLMTSQWPDDCDAITWKMISNSFDIDFIHSDIHGPSCKKLSYHTPQWSVPIHLYYIFNDGITKVIAWVINSILHTTKLIYPCLNIRKLCQEARDIKIESNIVTYSNKPQGIICKYILTGLLANWDKQISDK